MEAPGERGGRKWVNRTNLGHSTGFLRVRPPSLSGGADSDSASFSQQAATVDLQRTGAGNPRQRGISLRQRPTAAAKKTGDDSRLEQGLQPVPIPARAGAQTTPARKRK